MAPRILSITVPPTLRWDAEIQKSVHESIPYFVPGFVECQFDGDQVKVTYRDAASPEDKIKLDLLDLIKRTSVSFRDVREQQLHASPIKYRLASEDPFEALSASRAVVATGRGKFVYAKEFLAAFEALDVKLAEFCVSLGAVKELYPTTIETQSLVQSGYLKLSPQLAYFVAPAHLDHKCLVKVSHSDILDPEKREETLQQLGLPTQVMAPTVCFHCFEARKNTDVAPGLITALNKCHRHEPVNVRSLERLTTFWMRELIAFGAPADIQACLDDTLAWTTDLLDGWGAWYEVISANDPFFADMGSSNRLFQAAFALKRELKMPVLGGRRIATASFNNHQKTLVEKFDITSTATEDRSNFSSGCVAWGYERFLYSLFCQFGADLAAWPASVKRSLNL